jgi:hypothetical protein
MMRLPKGHDVHYQTKRPEGTTRALGASGMGYIQTAIGIKFARLRNFFGIAIRGLGDPPIRTTKMFTEMPIPCFPDDPGKSAISAILEREFIRIPSPILLLESRRFTAQVRRPGRHIAPV